MIDDGNLAFHRAMCKDRNCPTCLGAVVGALESFQKTMDRYQARLLAEGGAFFPGRGRAWYDRDDWFECLVREMAS